MAFICVWDLKNFFQKLILPFVLLQTMQFLSEAFFSTIRNKNKNVFKEDN